MNILITGGAGFIASQVGEAYIAAGHTVAIIDNFSTGKRQQVPKEALLFEGDITDKSFVEQVFQQFQPEVVNHHAAQISVVVSTHQPEHDAQINILGTLHLLEAAKATGKVKKIIYASSGGAMYGNPEQLPCSEDALPKPISPYGLSKWTAEQYVWLYEVNGTFEATVLRYSNVYGPRQDPHGEAGVCAIFTGKMLENQPVSIFGDGKQVRDYVYVKDVVQANLLALEKGSGEAYNICTGVGTDTNTVFSVLQSATNYTQEAIKCPPRPGEAQAVILSPLKANQELGWKAEYDFKQGTAETVAFYRQQSNR